MSIVGKAAQGIIGHDVTVVKGEGRSYLVRVPVHHTVLNVALFRSTCTKMGFSVKFSTGSREALDELHRGNLGLLVSDTYF